MPRAHGFAFDEIPVYPRDRLRPRSDGRSRLLGGFVFEPLRNWIRRKPELKWYDHVGLIATDPIGALNYMAESLLGIKSDIRVGIPRSGGVFVEFRIPLN
jgi:hypothetical protein